MKRWGVLAGVLLLFAAQWAVPFAQVVREEAIRREGMVWRFALQPVDPYDVMRGRYLALNFAANTTMDAPPGSKEGDTIYAVLQEDAQGLATVSRLSATPEDKAFALPLRFHAAWEWEDKPGAESPGQKVDVRIPLSRFYLPEDDALAIDRIVPRATSAEESSLQAVLEVRLKDGRLVADALWIDGQPYQQWLKAFLAEEEQKKDKSSK